MTTPFLSPRLLLFIPLVASCGARTPLPDLASEAGVNADAGADADASADAPVVTPDAPADQTSEPGQTPQSCKLAPAGDPVDLAPSVSAQSYTPSIVALNAGNAASSEPAHVLASWLRSDADSHPATVAVDYRVAPPWPDGLTANHEAIAVGPDSHSWNELAVAPGAGQSVSMVWWDDPGMVGRLRFRTLDVANWTMAEPVDLTSQSSEALGLVAGAGLGHPAGYGGDGYGLLWRVEDYDSNTSVPAVVVLDASGQIVMGPHQLSAISATKRTPAITWSGTTYLMATAFDACEPGDSLCKEQSVSITRVRPPSGDAYDDSGVELAEAIAVIGIGSIARRPTLLTHGGMTYVAWFESVAGDAGEVPTRVRLARLNADGTMESGPTDYADDALPIYSLSLTMGPSGLVLAWPEPGDPAKKANEPGASRLRLVTVDQTMQAAQHLTVDIPQFYSWGSRAAVGLAWPRGMMLVWTGMVKGGSSSHVHALRLDCM